MLDDAAKVQTPLIKYGFAVPPVSLMPSPIKEPAPLKIHRADHEAALNRGELPSGNGNSAIGVNAVAAAKVIRPSGIARSITLRPPGSEKRTGLANAYE